MMPPMAPLDRPSPLSEPAADMLPPPVGVDRRFVKVYVAASEVRVVIVCNIDDRTVVVVYVVVVSIVEVVPSMLECLDGIGKMTQESSKSR
jgi:hypothetical protein